MADVEETEEIGGGEVEGLAAVPDDLDAGLEVEGSSLDEGFSTDAEESTEKEASDDEEEAADSTTAAKGKSRGEDDEEEEDDDDEEDDVEADLDTILKDRIAAPPDEGEDEDDAVQVETEERTDGTGKIQPRKPDEFVCQSCFLVKHPSQLADPDDQLCADCV